MRLVQAVDEIDETIREIRTSIFALESHQHPGLRSEVLDLVNEIAERADLRPHVTFDGPIDLTIDPEVASDLLAVLREALSNAARHARATTLTVHLTSTDRIELRVADDGQGMPTERVGGSGLTNLEHRAQAHGGAFEITSPPGGGTCVVWSVPRADQLESGPEL